MAIIEFLLDKGAPIDAYYRGHSERWNAATNSLFLSYGWQNALHFAVSYGKKDLVEMLLSRVADKALKMFSLRTKLKQKTPLALTSLLGHEEIATLF